MGDLPMAEPPGGSSPSRAPNEVGNMVEFHSQVEAVMVRGKTEQGKEEEQCVDDLMLGAAEGDESDSSFHLSEEVESAEEDVLPSDPDFDRVHELRMLAEEKREALAVEDGQHLTAAIFSPSDDRRACRRKRRSEKIEKRKTAGSHPYKFAKMHKDTHLSKWMDKLDMENCMDGGVSKNKKASNMEKDAPIGRFDLSAHQHGKKYFEKDNSHKEGDSMIDNNHKDGYDLAPPSSPIHGADGLSPSTSAPPRPTCDTQPLLQSPTTQPPTQAPRQLTNPAQVSAPLGEAPTSSASDTQPKPARNNFSPTPASASAPTATPFGTDTQTAHPSPLTTTLTTSHPHDALPTL